jgi:hypothetical protein
VKDGIAIFGFGIGIAMAAWAVVQPHRVNVMLAWNAHSCEVDAELVELLKHPPEGGWAAQGRK